MRCKEQVRNSPSVLTIVSYLNSALGSCKVGKRAAEHVVMVSNRGPTPYDVAIYAECETVKARFLRPGRRTDHWTKTVHASWRPGHGGRSKHPASCPVVSCGAGNAEPIRTDTTVTAPHWPVGCKDSTRILVKTL